MELRTPNRRVQIIVLALLLLVAWNYWLPLVQDFLDLQTKPNAPANIDFYAYYTAGSRFQDGHNPYYWSQPGAAQVVFSEYLYPPTMLPIFGAMARLDYETARKVWFLIYFLLFTAALAVTARLLRREERWVFGALAGLLTMLSFPLLFHIRNGQADMIVISGMIFSVAAYMRGWKLLAAFLLAFGSLLKVSPALLLIFFVLFLRDWRFLLYFCLSALGMVAVSLFFVPFDWYVDYAVNVLPHVSQGMDYWFLQSVTKLFAANESLARIVSMVGVLIFGGFAWEIGRRVGASGRILRAPLSADEFLPPALLCMNLLAALAFGGRTWPMTYVWMILPCAVILTWLLRGGGSWRLAAGLGLGVFLLSSKVYGFPGLDSLNLIGALWMLLWLGWMVWHKAKPTA